MDAFGFCALRAFLTLHLKTFVVQVIDAMPVATLKTALVFILSILGLRVTAQNGYEVPAGSPGFYHGNSSASVTFDQYSLFLDDKRTLFLSGEFHPYRLPSTKLWKDVLQKYKAAGLNGVSIYLHWGLISPSQGINRWTDHNDIVKFYEIAKEVGLLVIARPGPYINAESAGGGLPAWLTVVPGLARTNATAYREAWHPYINEFAKLSAPYQYPDGPLIAVQAENEFGPSEWYHIAGLNEYMQDVIDTLRTGGLNKVPITHNDKNPGGAFVKGVGAVDLYGFDGYPAGFQCASPETWPELETNMHANHMKLSPAVPLALYEWQGGAFDYWNSNNGYDKCYKLTNEQFANVFYKNNIAGGVRLQNLYMTFGGSNWGNLGTETIYSSYDYGAAIREDRTVTPKLNEIKVQSYFLHASPAYMTSDRIGDGSQATGTPFSDSNEIYTTLWKDSKSGTGFYIVRQTTNTKLTPTLFTLRVNSTVLGTDIVMPSSGVMSLDGRESKILVADYKFGNSKLLFSTAEVLTWQTFDGVDYIYLYTSPSDNFEIIVQASGLASSNSTTPPGFTINSTEKYTVVSAQANRASAVTAIPVGNAVIILADKASALATWAPRLAPSTDPGHYTPSPDAAGVWIMGPYLVRSVSLNKGTLSLEGDLNSTANIDIWGPSSIKKVTWNGNPVALSRNTLRGSLSGTVKYTLKSNAIKIPDISRSTWKCIDNTPEAYADFDDSKWVVANKTSTNRPQKPYAGKYVLYGDEYGYHGGDLVWRGHFDGNATGVELSVQTGYSGAAMAYLNGNPIGSAQGSSTQWSGVDVQIIKATFDPKVLRSKNNVVTVYHDSMGLSQDYNVDDEFKKPRGIRGYKLLGNGVDFVKWTVAGNVGGESGPDRVRGPYNEGGWYYERIGAHLPGFNDTKWSACSPLTGRTAPGITVYRTSFDLNIPKGADVPLALDLELDSIAYRSVIWVNGWQFGRFASSLGPQTSYPVPEGILNHQGKNEVVVTLWALFDGGAKMKKLELNKRAVIESSKASNIGVVAAPDWKAADRKSVV